MPVKALLVTGASRGIGRACALLAARNGWVVGVNYREDAKAADAVVATIAKDGGRAVALKGDVAIEADAVAMFDAATKALGPLTAVIANAGIVAPTAKLADMSAERMRRIFEVNVLYSPELSDTPHHISMIRSSIGRSHHWVICWRTRSGRTGTVAPGLVGRLRTAGGWVPAWPTLPS